MYSPIITPMRRKGDLNLSINAIVVLILAITMLGLGLGFIRNVFGGAAGKVGAALEATSLKNPADSSNPVTIDDKITMKRTGEKEIEVGFYNTAVDPQENVRLRITGCSASNGEIVPDDQLPVIAAPAAATVEPSDGTGFKAIVSFPNESPLVGTYICSLGVISDASDPDPLRTTQFFLTLTS